MGREELRKEFSKDICEKCEMYKGCKRFKLDIRMEACMDYDKFLEDKVIEQKQQNR